MRFLSNLFGGSESRNDAEPKPQVSSSESNGTAGDTRIIIGVPGAWATQKDVVTSIARHSGGFIFAGLVIMDTTTRQGFKLEIYERDPKLHEAFRIAGGGRISDAEIGAIEKHVHTLYCSSSSISLDAARQMLNFGVGLLNAGGLAVKVESSGVAHSPARWRKFAASNDLFDIYTAFVTLIGGKDCFYSCGMHAFGLPEATVPRDLDAKDAAQLLNTFNHHLMADKPLLADGHTFSVAADAPRFKLRKMACDSYELEHPFHNPFGMWRLTRV
jgi:hypothetical protein